MLRELRVGFARAVPLSAPPRTPINRVTGQSNIHVEKGNEIFQQEIGAWRACRDDEGDRRPLHTLGDIGGFQPFANPRHQHQGESEADGMAETMDDDLAEGEILLDIDNGHAKDGTVSGDQR